jgi:hypothetical protein
MWNRRTGVAFFLALAFGGCSASSSTSSSSSIGSSIAGHAPANAVATKNCPNYTHCAYQGGTLILHGTNPYDGGRPLYIFAQKPLPAGVYITYRPNPVSGHAPNASTIIIETSRKTPPGFYTLKTFWAFNRDGSAPSVPAQSIFVVCDAKTLQCPTL